MEAAYACAYDDYVEVLHFDVDVKSMCERCMKTDKIVWKQSQRKNLDLISLICRSPPNRHVHPVIEGWYREHHVRNLACHYSGRNQSFLYDGISVLITNSAIVAVSVRSGCLCCWRCSNPRFLRAPTPRACECTCNLRHHELPNVNR